MLSRFTFRVAGQDLVFNFVDVAIDGGEQLLPANSQRLHRVLGVAVLEDHRFLDALVEFFELLHVRLVSVDILLVLLEADELILERALQCTTGALTHRKHIRRLGPKPKQVATNHYLHAHGDRGHGVHLALDPRSHRVGLFGELASHELVVLLFAQFGLQSAVPLRHQLAHFRPFVGDVLCRVRPG